MAPGNKAARAPAGRALARLLALQLLAPLMVTPAAAQATVTMAALDCFFLYGLRTDWRFPINLGTCNPPPQCTREDRRGWRNSGRKSGIFCDAAGRVSALVLRKGSAKGPLPDFSGLRGLRALMIPGDRNTRVVTGSVPSSWRTLRLTDLDLGGNPGLTGAIPNSVLAGRSLRYVNVAYSGIRGNVAPFSRRAIPGARMTLVVSGRNPGETPEICGLADNTITLRSPLPDGRLAQGTISAFCSTTLIGFNPPSGPAAVRRRLRAAVQVSAQRH